MEGKTSKLNKRGEQKPPEDLETLENMLHLVDSMIKDLKESDSQYKNKLEYLTDKKNQALEQMAKIKENTK